MLPGGDTGLFISKPMRKEFISLPRLPGGFRFFFGGGGEIGYMIGGSTLLIIICIKSGILLGSWSHLIFTKSWKSPW